MPTIDLRSSSSVIPPEPTEEEVAAYRKKNINVAFSSVYVDKFEVKNLPSHLHGEWHADTPYETAKMQSLGFTRGDEIAQSNDFANKGSVDGSVKIQDVVFWVIPKRFKQELDNVAEMKRQANEDPRRAAKFLEGQLAEDKKFTTLPKTGENVEVNQQSTLKGAEAKHVIEEAAAGEALRAAERALAGQ